MKRILDELLRVQNLVGSEVDFFINQKFRADLEWWVLGKTVENLKNVGWNSPEYAEESRTPDFFTFDEKKNAFRPFEITEALEIGRKRSDEYLEAKKKKMINEPLGRGKLLEPLPDPWTTLRQCLTKKYAKRYALQTWLIVYFNISYGNISEFGYWHETILANAKNWNLDNSPFERVLVLNASGEAMVEIFPQSVVVTEEK